MDSTKRETVAFICLWAAALLFPFLRVSILFSYGPLLLFFVMACASSSAMGPLLLRMAVKSSPGFLRLIRSLFFFGFLAVGFPIQENRPLWTTVTVAISAGLLLHPWTEQRPCFRSAVWAAGSGVILMAAAGDSWFFLCAWLTLLPLLLLPLETLEALRQAMGKCRRLHFFIFAWFSLLFLASWFYFGRFGIQPSLLQFAAGWRRDLAAMAWGCLPALLTWPLLRLHLAPVWRWLLAIHGFTAAFLVAEFLLRAFGPVGYGRGQDGVQADYAELHYQRAGATFRDVPHTLAKPPGTRRILTLGDSVTFGAGVPLELIYPRILEENLNRQAGNIRFEVINISRSGWNTSDELNGLKERGLGYGPDLVVLGFVLNDGEAPGIGYDFASFLPESMDWAMNWSYLYTLLRFSYTRLLEALDFRASYLDYLKGLYTSGQPGWETCRNDLREMTQILQSKNIPLLVVVFPVLYDFPAYPFQEVHRQVAECAASSGAEVLDLLPVYQRYDPRELCVSFADGHPNAKGHDLAAEAILEAIRGRPGLQKKLEKK